ncbi:MAG: YpmS family protein [Solibacillus sp.]
MNKWKVAFLILAGAIILAVAGLFYYATADVEQAVIQDPVFPKGNVLKVETTAKEFEAIAKKYLGDELKKTPIQLEMAIEDKIYLYTTLTVFNVEFPIQLDYDPIVKNGNIILKQTAIHVGEKNISPKAVLKLIDGNVDFPPWITVQPNDEQIFVDLSLINIASGSRVRAKEIDLANDKILLEVIIPNDKK